ncbi:hypothetical protein EAV90_05060 [Bradyrhizobium vignae]|nr:hypothetical protein EAV90_05060 [Bradyrhizobium vignae]
MRNDPLLAVKLELGAIPTRQSFHCQVLRFGAAADAVTAIPSSGILTHPPPPSLRAQGSNPDCLRGGTLDCFVARAPRNCARRELRMTAPTQSNPG